MMLLTLYLQLNKEKCVYMLIKKTSLRCTEWISLVSERIIQVTSQQKEHINAILFEYNQTSIIQTHWD